MDVLLGATPAARHFVSATVRRMLSHGKPHPQAVAIALDAARRQGFVVGAALPRDVLASAAGSLLAAFILSRGVSGEIVGVRVLETPEDTSRFRLETGWHWFSRQYPDGRFSPTWWTTRDAARRGLLSSSGAKLWGWDEVDRRWVTDSLLRAGRVI